MIKVQNKRESATRQWHSAPAGMHLLWRSLSFTSTSWCTRIWLANSQQMCCFNKAALRLSLCSFYSSQGRLVHRVLLVVSLKASNGELDVCVGNCICSLSNLAAVLRAMIRKHWMPTEVVLIIYDVACFGLDSYINAISFLWDVSFTFLWVKCRGHLLMSICAYFEICNQVVA